MLLNKQTLSILELSIHLIKNPLSEDIETKPTLHLKHPTEPSSN